MAATEWSERTRMLVTVGISLAVNVGLGYFCYSAHSTYLDLEKKLQTKQNTIKMLKKVVDEEGPQLRRDLANKQRTLERKEKLLPDADGTEELIVKMAELAEKTGAVKKGISDAGQDGSGNYVRKVWRTRWTADFMSWCKFLNTMEEHFDRFVSFENLTISPKNSGMIPTGVQHEINVDVVVYRYVRK